MDFLKLKRKEWESIEIPIAKEEKDVLSFMMACYDNNELNKSESCIRSLSNLLQVQPSKVIEDYLYNEFFREEVEMIKTLFRKSPYDSESITFYTPKKKTSIKTADKIRISSQSANVNQTYELLLLKELKDSLTVTNKRKYTSIYTLHKLVHINVRDKNTILHQLVFDIAALIFKHDSLQMETFVFNCTDVIEKNAMLLYCENRALYSHQKLIFQHFPPIKTREAKLAFYIAPTGTGKTLTPICLCSQYKVIFVCAARHVGLSLARSAISMGKRIAFAFGCESTGDIRLHNSAAVKFDRDYKSGSIRNIDNSVGTKVEMIICDVHSYQYACLYLKAFNEVDDILTFWDEPTISLDVDEHPFHRVIHENWASNTISKLILSSATLPSVQKLYKVVEDFESQFKELNPIVCEIKSFDFKKSIPIIDPRGYIEMPHFICETIEDVHDFLASFQDIKNMSLLRYLDLEEIIRFIQVVEENHYIPQQLFVSRNFLSIDDISMESIKLHYLEILKGILPGCWGSVFLKCKMERTRKFAITEDGNKQEAASDLWGIFLSSKDSHTLTDGPTLFMTSNVMKIATFFIQQSNLPKQILDNITNQLRINTTCSERMTEIRKELEYEKQQADISSDDSTAAKSNKKKQDKEPDTLNGKQLRLKQEYEVLTRTLKPIELSETYVPNKPYHLKRFTQHPFANVFTSDIDSSVVEEIVSLRGVNDQLKLLLLMGIGAFDETVTEEYLELIKLLASQQRLYLIIGNTDYIYGTNYQFCHAYLSKDLDLTREKILQCVGRVGRKNIQQMYSIRLRDKKQSRLLFLNSYDTNEREIHNMNRLFVR